MSRATPHETPPKVQVERTFAVDSMSRVEGEGRLRVVVRGDEVVSAELSIFEAPRFFERLVVGRHPDEVLDIVARICGICPVAYQMTAVEAFERLFEVQLDPQVRHVRRLFYGASGYRATRCTSTCSTRPTSWATTALSTWLATTAASWNGAWR